LADGYEVEGASATRELRLKAGWGCDLLLLGELHEPGAALRFLRTLRAGEAAADELDPALPVLVLLADRSQLALLRAFEAGCDDAVPSGVSYLELRARVRAILRRARRGEPMSPRRIGALIVDPRRREASHAGVPLVLTRLEFELLCRLASEPGRVFTKRELLRTVWGFKAEPRTRTVDAHALRLRRRLARAGARERVENVRGVGYRLVPGGPVAAAARLNGRPQREAAGAA
jgi:DNA-binding response OmpR family regulator